MSKLEKAIQRFRESQQGGLSIAVRVARQKLQGAIQHALHEEGVEPEALRLRLENELGKDTAASLFNIDPEDDDDSDEHYSLD